MTYRLHPEAASEHEEQVAFYEGRAPGLGSRYHAAFRAAALRACNAPKRFKVISAPDIRRASINGFPYSIVFRESQDQAQILAIAHHRRRPGYWVERLSAVDRPK